MRARLFQSAPLTDVRGDYTHSAQDLLLDEVSIRSPHGCKGRCVPVRKISTQPFMFQSAPLTDVRGDASTIEMFAHCMHGFNPLPSRM